MTCKSPIRKQTKTYENYDYSTPGHNLLQSALQTTKTLLEWYIEAAINRPFSLSDVFVGGRLPPLQ